MTESQPATAVAAFAGTTVDDLVILAVLCMVRRTTGSPHRRPPGRPPLPLETSLPGIFAAGDVRRGSVNRVAAAVGEGAATIPLVHRYLHATAPR